MSTLHSKRPGQATRLFEALKSVSALEAARRAGIDITMRGRRGWARCFIHGEKTASLCLYEEPQRGWVCYGCHNGGDAVALYAALYSTDRVTAAKQLAKDMGIDYDDTPAPRKKPQPTAYDLQRALDKRRNADYSRLCDELHKAERAQKAAEAILAGCPATDDSWDDHRYGTAIKALCYAKYVQARIGAELDWLHTADHISLAQYYAKGAHK